MLKRSGPRRCGIWSADMRPILRPFLRWSRRSWRCRGVSFASNTSLRSPLTGGVLLVHARKAPLCLDEALPGSEITSTFRTGGNVQPPKVKKRVEPQFPRLLSQSPYPELNGAALLALSQWRFTPGYLDGKPADVIFNLTVNFKTH